MKIGLVMCAWVDDNGVYKPQILADYAVAAYSNITGNQAILPDPNQVVVAVAIASDVDAALLAVDPNYTVLTDDGVTDGVLFSFSGAADSHWLNEVMEWLDG